MGSTNRPLERMSIRDTFSGGIEVFAFSIIIGFIPGVLIFIGQSIHGLPDSLAGNQDSQELISWVLYTLAAIFFLCGISGLWTKFAADAISIGIQLNKKYKYGRSPSPGKMNLFECLIAGFDTISYVFTFILISSFSLFVGITLQDSKLNDVTGGFVSTTMVVFSFGVFFVGVIGLRTKVLADAISAGLSMKPEF